MGGDLVELVRQGAQGGEVVHGAGGQEGSGLVRGVGQLGVRLQGSQVAASGARQDPGALAGRGSRVLRGGDVSGHGNDPLPAWWGWRFRPRWNQGDLAVGARVVTKKCTQVSGYGILDVWCRRTGLRAGCWRVSSP